MMLVPLLEAEGRTGDKVDHGAGDENLALGPTRSAMPRRDVHCDSPEVIATYVALTYVKARTHLDP